MIREESSGRFDSNLSTNMSNYVPSFLGPIIAMRVSDRVCVCHVCPAFTGVHMKVSGRACGAGVCPCMCDCALTLYTVCLVHTYVHVSACPPHMLSSCAVCSLAHLGSRIILAARGRAAKCSTARSIDSTVFSHLKITPLFSDPHKI